MLTLPRAVSIAKRWLISIIVKLTKLSRRSLGVGPRIQTRTPTAQKAGGYCGDEQATRPRHIDSCHRVFVHRLLDVLGADNHASAVSASGPNAVLHIRSRRSRAIAQGRANFERDTGDRSGPRVASLNPESRGSADRPDDGPQSRRGSEPRAQHREDANPRGCRAAATGRSLFSAVD